MLDCIVAEVREKCRVDGKMLHWQVFRDRVLGPIMDNTAAPSLDEICQKHNIESAQLFLGNVIYSHLSAFAYVFRVA